MNEYNCNIQQDNSVGGICIQQCEQSENKVPILTICVPTYNRDKQVYALLQYITANITSKYDTLVEVVVVNNMSSDGTSILLSGHHDINTRIIQRTTFLPTAEENIFRSLEYCHGEYIWFLGDDDYPILRVVDELLNQLLGGTSNIYIFNTPVVDEDGRNIVDRSINMNALFVDININELVCSTGLLFALAGISRIVFKRSMVNLDSALTILKVQSIYSHAIWLIKSFHGNSIRVINLPLVSYTVFTDKRDADRFVDLVKTTSAGTYEYWSFGLIRLLNILISEHLISPDELYRTFEIRRDGSHFRLLDFVVHMCWRQIHRYVSTGNANEAVSTDVFEESRKFVLSIDPSFSIAFGYLENLLYCATSIGSRFSRHFTAKKISSQFNSSAGGYVHFGDRVHKVLYRGMLYNYNIYQGPSRWVAINPLCHINLEKVVLCLDPSASAPCVYIGNDLCDIERQLIENIKYRLQSGIGDGDPFANTSNAENFRRTLDAFNVNFATLLELFRQASAPKRVLWKYGYRPYKKVRDKIRSILSRLL
ncbi:glycosyltransferase family 2 protein [Acidithiobacillus ferriphilus]|uniref:glycosyltransferase family 2 protein n=1 Tax=Acidithiobacillus ferriphilus TaxID=1689834 RepID=UPI002DBD088A|nr:glycosyltransferase family 2 protein [Acidithiobacillus ferriphilus]MEB8585428.1 glycosyltransferase family 2 protein [Acidithiobacillus ferriphilus]